MFKLTKNNAAKNITNKLEQPTLSHRKANSKPTKIPPRILEKKNIKFQILIIYIVLN